MKTSNQGLLAILRHEGIVPAPYLDVSQVWTFGVGHTAAAGAPDPAKMPRGMPADIDAAIRDAFAVFRRDLAKYEREVLAAVKVALAQHEFDALVSFHYNTGGIAKAALTRFLNAGNRAAAAEAFMGWLKPAAIRPRREAERLLFATGQYPAGTIPIWSVDPGGRVDFSRLVRRLGEADALALMARPVEPPAPVPAPNATQTQPAPVAGWFAALWQRLRQLFTRKDTP